MKIHWNGFLFLTLLWPIVSCSKLKEELPGKKDLIVTPVGRIFKSEKEWEQGTKDFNPPYRDLHLRMIRSAQDWKQYILDIFPEAKENPPASVPAYSHQPSERSFALYSDFLNTGKPIVVFVETMPNLATIKTLVVSEWNKNHWNELIKMNEEGIRTPYVVSLEASKKFKGYTIKLYENRTPGEKSYFIFLPGECNPDLQGCSTLDAADWKEEMERYCFVDTSGPNEDGGYREICDEKDWDQYQ